MGRKAKKGMYVGLKGWEINYLKKAEEFGHLTPTPNKRSKKQHNKHYKGN